LLAPIAPEVAAALGAIQYASVSVITLTVPTQAIAHRLAGTGFLVPRTTVIDGRPALITGCTFLSRKWPHLARPGDELIRISVGRWGDDRQAEMDDAQLVSSAFAELARILGIAGGPTAAHLHRWEQALPQYRVGHLATVAGIEEAVGRIHGLAVAGAAYRGVGIPACIGSGRAAGRAVLGSLVAPVSPESRPAE
jgi:protoporphyrinogen/coproporphyrinogen III oxidase